MIREPGMELTLEWEPANFVAYGAYADWLEEHGSPEAALIAGLRWCLRRGKGPMKRFGKRIALKWGWFMGGRSWPMQWHMGSPKYQKPPERAILPRLIVAALQPVQSYRYDRDIFALIAYVGTAVLMLEKELKGVDPDA